MSYCVNCGVELEKSLKSCPLCNTPVINPKEIKYNHSETPFPKEKGTVEEANRNDAAIFITIILVAAALGCGGLNWLVFTGTLWSVAVIGVFVVLWVILFPVIIVRKTPAYISVLLDGAAMILYLYMLTWLTRTNNWFYGLGIPIVVLTTVIVEALVLCWKFFPPSILLRGLLGVTALGLFCTGLEILIDYYLYDILHATWSAVIAVVCIIVDVMIITVLCRRRLRNEIRRRLHF